MQFGVALPHFSRLASREAVLTTAREAEALGYDSVWTTDHVLMAANQPEPYGTILEASITLTYVAAVTERVRLGTSVIVLPQREPVLVAKQAATLDVLSNGRLILGVGAGWNEREFGFLGASFHDRGRRLDEYIQALRVLWSAPDPHFAGQFVRFGEVSFQPRPIQPGGPPDLAGRGQPRRAAPGGHTVRRLARGGHLGGRVRGWYEHDPGAGRPTPGIGLGPPAGGRRPYAAGAAERQWGEPGPAVGLTRGDRQSHPGLCRGWRQ
jgi:probable F420-dependent oxidoreductase